MMELINNIPSDWEITKLKFFSKIFGRIGFRGYTASDLVDEGEGAITLGPPNIVNQKLNLENKRYLSWEKYEESPEIKVYNTAFFLLPVEYYIGTDIDIPSGILCIAIAIARDRPNDISLVLDINVATPSGILCNIIAIIDIIPTLYKGVLL